MLLIFLHLVDCLLESDSGTTTSPAGDIIGTRCGRHGQNGIWKNLCFFVAVIRKNNPSHETSSTTTKNHSEYDEIHFVVFFRQGIDLVTD